MLNNFRDIHIHEMIERFELVGDDLAPIRLCKVKVQDMPVGRNHFMSAWGSVHSSNFKEIGV
jgi:hypothetical protein